MKRLSMALAATALLAVAGCGSRTVNNIAVVDNSTNDVYDVAPDSLTLNDTNASGNASSGSNASSANTNSSGSNASGGGNSSSTAGNSH
jgi:hypothetical protein